MALLLSKPRLVRQVRCYLKELALEVLIHVGPLDPGILFTRRCADELAKALGVHAQTLVNIDNAWREWFNSHPTPEER